ncbi:tRNA-binding protein [Candidatus Halocynthiibacter alkanivorans]|uniref:tRNA-binding protein n=1 Tax=Candidatus Halocynthiibacter alkanivorans TaxID=2267619 RepID=UPI000DF269BE|nr:tRNA-binding protein [Candidatus Halocynthiibacter alkanivorans]
MERDQIVYDDFARIEMRIGEIVEVLPFPRARNPAYKVAVKFGDIGVKWSSAQITRYTAEDLLGRHVVCVVNMPPRNIAGFQSEILIMGASNDQDEVVLLQPESAVLAGGEVF